MSRIGKVLRTGLMASAWQASVGAHGRRSPPVASGFAATAPGYLSAVVTPYAVFGVQRLVSGYSGALFQLTRASDNATLDIYAQTGGDYPDMAAISTWIGASSATYAKLYDQTGNGRDLAQATVANQPAYDPGSALGNPVSPVCFASTVASGGFNAAGPYLTATGWALDRIAHSLFYFGQQSNGMDGRQVLSFSSGATTLQDHYSGGGRLAVIFDPAGTPAFVSPAVTAATKEAPRPMPTVYGFTNNSTVSTTYAYNTSVAAGARAAGNIQTSTNMPTFTMGRTGVQNAGMPSDLSMHGLVIYASTVGSTDAATIVGSLNTACTGYTGAYDYNVVFDGDSIMRGNTMIGQRNMPNQLNAVLTKKMRYLNTGVPGTNIEGIYAARVARFSNALISGMPNIFFMQAGSNSFNSTPGTGAGVYSTTTTPFITYLQGLGFKVCVCTILPRSDFGVGGAQDNNRLDYNTAVRANAAAADYVLDLVAHPLLGGTTNNTTYYTNESSKWVHPNSEGYRYLAGAPSGTYSGTYTYFAALQAMLRTATGNSSYVP